LLKKVQFDKRDMQLPWSAINVLISA